MAKKKLTDRILNFFGLGKRAVGGTSSQASLFGKGKQTVQFNENWLSNLSFIPRRAYRNVDIEDVLEAKHLNSAQILELLSDIDPDVSMALWNTLRLSNKGWNIKVYKQTSDNIIDTRGQKLVDNFVLEINKGSGGLNNIINQMHRSAFLQGAICGEAVMDGNLKKVIDLAPTNPHTIYFKVDPDDGTLKTYQYQLKPKEGATVLDNNYVELNTERFWYIPLDPAIGDPYGRGPATAAIADVFFNLKVMFDLRKVIHSQGWPRLDVTVMSDTLRANAPESIKMDEDKLNEFINKQLKEIESTYNSVKPDDTYIHLDAIQVGSANPASQGGRLFDPTALLRCIERRVIRALKQLPVFMGSNEGTTETHGTVQFEIYAEGINSIQQMSKNLMERFLEFYLRMEGVQSRVEFEFEKVQTTDRKVEADAEAIEIQNAVTKRDEGWISQDEASIEITGSEAIEDLETIKAAQVPVGGNPAPTGGDGTEAIPPAGNKLNNAKKKDRKLTITEQKRKYKQLRDNFLNVLGDTFSEIEAIIPSEKIANEVYKLHPKSPENTIPTDSNKLDVNSPVYKDALNIVKKYFEGNKVKKIMNNLSEEGAGILTEAYENYAQRTLINLGRKNATYKGAEFKLDNLGIQKLIDERASFFPTSSFETAQNDIAKVVTRGYQENKGASEIATDLRDKFESMRTSRSNLIANQELNWATSQGSLTTMQKNGVSKKEWQTVGDDRVRPEHQANEDQGAIGVYETFQSGDDAPPADFNCRCQIAEVIDEDWDPPAELWQGQ